MNPLSSSNSHTDAAHSLLWLRDDAAQTLLSLGEVVERPRTTQEKSICGPVKDAVQRILANQAPAPVNLESFAWKYLKNFSAGPYNTLRSHRAPTQKKKTGCECRKWTDRLLLLTKGAVPSRKARESVDNTPPESRPVRVKAITPNREVERTVKARARVARQASVAETAPSWEPKSIHQLTRRYFELVGTGEIKKMPVLNGNGKIAGTAALSRHIEASLGARAWGAGWIRDHLTRCEKGCRDLSRPYTRAYKKSRPKIIKADRVGTTFKPTSASALIDQPNSIHQLAQNYFHLVDTGLIERLPAQKANGKSTGISALSRDVEATFAPIDWSVKSISGHLNSCDKGCQEKAKPYVRQYTQSKPKIANTDQVDSGMYAKLPDWLKTLMSDTAPPSTSSEAAVHKENTPDLLLCLSSPMCSPVSSPIKAPQSAPLGMTLLCRDESID